MLGCRPAIRCDTFAPCFDTLFSTRGTAVSLLFNENIIVHSIPVIFSRSTSLLRSGWPSGWKTTRIMSTREDDDIDYFGKCITGVSRVCSLPRAYLSLRGPGVGTGFKSQLLSVMELRTAVIYGARSWTRWGSSSQLENRHDGRGEEPREKVNTLYIERAEAALGRVERKKSERTPGETGGKGEKGYVIRETRAK